MKVGCQQEHYATYASRVLYALENNYSTLMVLAGHYRLIGLLETWN